MIGGKMAICQGFLDFIGLCWMMKWLPLVEQYRTICMMPNAQTQYAFEAVATI